MKIGAIVQARMSSRRLAGKVLERVEDKPLLAYLLERLARCDGLDDTVVATSVEPSDDAVEDFCGEFGAECLRGPLDDVAGRYVEVIKHKRLDAFVRVCADSPLLDDELVTRGLTLFGEGDCDLATNVHPRSFPAGQSVEVLDSEVFLSTYEAIEEKNDLEHVTSFFYRNADRFRIRNFTSDLEPGDVSFAVDSATDLAMFQEIVRAMDRPHWTYHLPELMHMRRELDGTPS